MNINELLLNELENKNKWPEISKRLDLSMEIIDTFKDKLYWQYIWKNYKIDNIEKYIEYIDWELI